MDPKACWELIVEAKQAMERIMAEGSRAEGDYDDALADFKDGIQNLAEWLRKGGYAP